MIVTCPACATRYLVDPRALGVTGRSVRCTQCRHVWPQSPPEDAPRRVDLPTRGGSPSPPPRALPAPPALAAMPAMAGAHAGGAMPRQFSYPGGLAETVARGGSPLVILLVVILVLGGLWWGRNTIVQYIPALGGVYSALGLAEGGDPSRDLEFRQVTSDRQQENGRATLVIHGEVANISHDARRVPPLRITLQDAARHAVKSWTIVATSDRLRPGATVAFRTSVSDPGDTTVGASVSFDTGTD
ncbi:MAG TPA: DUF3426 domain-containing protein [Stellaceae bacterium]|nr:DUF3426 domain-containing protein [Stellaceae bacterium]